MFKNPHLNYTLKRRVSQANRRKNLSCTFYFGFDFLSFAEKRFRKTELKPVCQTEFKSVKYRMHQPNDWKCPKNAKIVVYKKRLTDRYTYVYDKSRFWTIFKVV